jgi:hypothetical protein
MCGLFHNVMIFVLTESIVIIIIVIIILITTFMLGIYNYIPKKKQVSRVHSVATVKYLKFVLHVMLFHM